jgi:hypothetical protein
MKISRTIKEVGPGTRTKKRPYNFLITDAQYTKQAIRRVRINYISLKMHLSHCNTCPRFFLLLFNSTIRFLFANISY